MWEQYEHPIVTELREQSEGAGHGGMDFVEDYRLIKCLNEGLPDRHQCLSGGVGQRRV